MRKHYDFSNAIKNPYAKKLKRQVTIRLDLDTLDYFRKISVETDMPYQKLIKLRIHQSVVQQLAARARVFALFRRNAYQ